MSIKHVFKCHLPSAQYMFKRGTSAIFVRGRFETDNAEQIGELMEEVKGNHPHIFVDPKEPTVDSDLQEKIRKAQADAVDKVMKDSAEQIANLNKAGSEILAAAGQISTEASTAAVNTATVVSTSGPSSGAKLLDLSGLDSLSNVSGTAKPALVAQTSKDIAAGAAGQ